MKIAIYRFFFKPASFTPLAALRISVAAILLLQAYLIAPEFLDFFGARGLMQESLQSVLADPMAPRLAPYVAWMSAKFGVGESMALSIAGAAYLFSLIGLMVGFLTHASAVGAWFLHWVFTSSGACANYGADMFAHIFLFYLIFLPSGRAWSVDARLKPGTSRSWTARLGLRVVQFHLCIVYLSSAFDKVVGPQWLNGEIMWRALMLPVYNQFDFAWLAQVPLLAKVIGWGSLVIEFGYCIFIWPKATRKLWVALTVSLHLGIAVFLGLWVFGLLMTAFTWTVFGISAEPKEKTVRRKLFRLPFLVSVPQLANDVSK